MIKDIYFLNANELAIKLNKGLVNDILALKHLIAFSILFRTGYEIPIELNIESESDSSSQWVTYILMWVFSAIINYYGL